MHASRYAPAAIDLDGFLAKLECAKSNTYSCFIKH